MKLYLLLVTLSCAFILSTSRPNGAPKSACSSLMPLHSGIGAQRSSPPYTVDAVKYGNKVKITLSSPVGEEFEGFVLQARSRNDRTKFIPGEFTSSQNAKTLECFNHKKGTLTQVGANPKREVVTEWTPRGSINEDVVFRATIAKTFAVFWTEIDSEPIRIRNEGHISTSELSSNRNPDSIYDGCFTSKGCFGLPTDCVQSGDCEVLLTYGKTADGINYRMHGFLDPSVYMAMGLSTDSSMGDDSVTECFRDNSNNIIARESWNDGKRNGRTRDLSTYEGSYVNGMSSCSWTLPYQTEMNDRNYNLMRNNYYILLAKGAVENGALRYHSDRLASGEAVNFTAFEAILGSGGGVADSIKIHGTFMVTAWVGFVSLAILLARHFKNTWEESTLGGVKIWFALHRGFMVAALVFFSIAFIVIFVHQNGWNYHTTNPHAILGCIAVALGVFNPIMALFRPAPDDKKRPIFNWLHWAVGTGAHIVAIITIFFAKSLPSSGLNNNFYWVMSIFVVVHIVFHLLYQTHTWTQSAKKNNEIGMNEMNGARPTPHNGQSVQAKNISENVFRILLLGIYSVFLLAILIALYALIGVA